MRYALPLLALLLFTGCAGPQQTAGLRDADAPPKVQTVIVQSDLAATDAYRALARELQGRGYTLSHSDATLMTLSTDLKEFGSYRVKMNGSVDGDGVGSVVRLRGSYVVPTFGNQEHPIEKLGLEGSVPRNAWAEMHSVAEALGSEITYE